MNIMTKPPTSREMSLAIDPGRRLASYLHSKKRNDSIQIILDGNKQESLNIPIAALKLLVDILVEISEGNAITLMPVHTELSTQQAADLLNVSRPYLVKLLDEGVIPFRKVGTKRRVLARDILNYKDDIDKNRLETLEKLSAQAQQLKMGYDDD